MSANNAPLALTYNGQKVVFNSAKSVLDNLLNAGISVPYSCKSGICQSCLLQCKSGQLDLDTHAGLKQALVDLGYFKACCAFASTDLVVSGGEPKDYLGEAVVTEKRMLSDRVCEIFLEPATSLYYHAGQFINLRRADGETRSYSLASLPAAQGPLEIHVQRMQNGILSNWLVDEVEVGDHLQIQGPYGECYYRPLDNLQAMLLVANESGLAPALGIVRDAINSGFKGEIYLFHGSKKPSGLYLHQALHNLAKVTDNLFYQGVLTCSQPCDSQYQLADLLPFSFKHFPDLRDFSVYLCGDKDLVEQGQTLALSLGAHHKRIYRDPFCFRELRKTKRRNHAA
ncbi:FAD-binding oxidoreductase [Motilimonas pumila]|uniref:Ferredoxin reductase n=1 Tax=Motilimonas pumila TaxID=2303987 RepID=A0A418YIM6_9GAMM|nr:FAD-binding oxidoreductase [Motilimonas pumila]RJG50480.1 ferredoxin reductase [Motilimonas pumila]